MDLIDQVVLLLPVGRMGNDDNINMTTNNE